MLSRPAQSTLINRLSAVVNAGTQSAIASQVQTANHGTVAGFDASHGVAVIQMPGGGRLPGKAITPNSLIQCQRVAIQGGVVDGLR